MKTRPTDPRAVPVASLARDGAGMSGEAWMAGLPRLREALFEPPPDTALVRWRARFGLEERPGLSDQQWLELEAGAHVTLQCQRCLKAMNLALEVERRFRFVASEAEAERLDADSDDDHLVLQPRLDLIELVEDELILALPLVPRHEDPCPEPLASVIADEETPERPNPFAALAALRRSDGRH